MWDTTRVFNMACDGACEADRVPFTSRPVIPYSWIHFLEVSKTKCSRFNTKHFAEFKTSFSTQQKINITML